MSLAPLSRFEIAVNKNDFRQVSSLARSELTLEDFIDGFFRTWQKLDCPDGRDFHYMVVYQSRDFSRIETIRKLGITLKEFNDFLDRLRSQCCPPTGVTLEQMIDGFIRLWYRLSCPGNKALHWMTVYWVRDFDRAETARRLGKTLESFDKKLARFKARAHIAAKSVRHTSAG